MERTMGLEAGIPIFSHTTYYTCPKVDFDYRAYHEVGEAYRSTNDTHWSINEHHFIDGGPQNLDIPIVNSGPQ